MSVRAILADLVAFPCRPGQPNGRIVDHVRDRLAQAGIDATVLTRPEGDRANLFATIGPRDVSGYILSGHIDVIPVENQTWTSDPFRLHQHGDRLHGRGTTDMKGFLAAMLAVAPELQAMPPQRPVHLAFSFDEEIGCRGVGHMIARLPDLCASPTGAVSGEPTAMHPVLSHKGKQSLETLIEGKAGHSPNPAPWENALSPAADIITAIRHLARQLEDSGERHTRFVPPFRTCQAGMIRRRGGEHHPRPCGDRIRIAQHSRHTPAHPPRSWTAWPAMHIKTGGRCRSRGANWPAIPRWPPPMTSPSLRLCSACRAAISFTPSAMARRRACSVRRAFPPSSAAPGNIGRAHRHDEYILTFELDECCTMMRGPG